MSIRFAFWITAAVCAVNGMAEGPRVRFVEGKGRIDIRFDDRPFTSYLFADSLAKPVLHPLRSPSGLVVTRGFPLDPRPGETTDHPHHIGVFFTVDEVNGNGFWNALKPPPRIRHLRVTDKQEGKGHGTLSTVSHWTGMRGQVLLREDRTMAIHPEAGRTIVDFFIRLTAVDTAVTFSDTKEGMFAVRVADWLRENGGTGRYLSSTGAETEPDVWGRRAAWMRLEGTEDGLKVGLALFYHPQSIHFPTYWHARGYGLFSANPLGRKVFEEQTGNPDAVAYNLTLVPGDSATFCFRLVVYEGTFGKAELDEWFGEFVRHNPQGVP